MFYIGIFVFLLLAVNFFYRVINLFIKINRQAYSQDTTHTFKCSTCNQSYTLTGPETKKLVKGAVVTKKSTPRSRTTFYQFRCPQCGSYSNQEKIFDINTTKGLGTVRAQIDSDQLPLVIDFLLKGVLPIFLAMPFLNLIIR
ncbi:hypothetical protein [Enterococcus sp. AZ072]|uniref:hypothetical protein n=1 Tax=unclassified Enterococcus TaxID=2608891 RepID=UPI003D266DB2